MKIRQAISKVGAVVGLALLNAEAGLYITLGTIVDLPELSDVGLRIILNNKKLFDLMKKTNCPALSWKEFQENKELQMAAIEVFSSPQTRKAHLCVIK